MTVAVVKHKRATVGSGSDMRLLFSRITQAPRLGPGCCSSLTSALGTIQIMVGLFNIGLGLGRTSKHPGDLANLGAAYWLGAVYLTSGIFSVFANLSPFYCLVVCTVIMNLIGAIFAITGIALYGVDLGDSIVWMCDNWMGDDGQENCIVVAYLAQRLLTSMDITLIVLAAVQLFANIYVTVLAIKALVGEEQPVRKVEEYQLPLGVVMSAGA